MQAKKDFLILLVDDADLARLTLRTTLSSMGFTHFVQAASGNEALEVLKKQAAAGEPVDLVTCDINMPGQSGIDFLKSVRGEPSFKDLPVIMVTVESEVSKVLECIVNGADDYLIKPFTSESVSQKISTVLMKRSA